jgi:phosphoserine phosphatase
VIAPTRVLVLRHGESEWNALGRWQGLADPALSDKGRRQAAGAALQLGTFDGIWASSLTRAFETAAIIAELNGIGPVQIEPLLRETDVGPWQGLTTPQIETEWPGFLARGERPDGFEPYDIAGRRMLDGLGAVAAQHPVGSELLVVSHSGVIRSARQQTGGDDRRFPNLCGGWFDVHGDGRIIARGTVDLRSATRV